MNKVESKAVMSGTEFIEWHFSVKCACGEIPIKLQVIIGKVKGL